ncbi:unnamed protein product [Cyprideis torosa]|uniref:Uncharacterized protein n=1 Tax=Cyprideis torosa TaxID=163714 RepID=A0A7R8ZNX7_9CRUS|nr:unnamed protein product [Cyprideis torosa]CAG0897433.1 unnamed protein product [Cyprideis torosa]
MAHFGATYRRPRHGTCSRVSTGLLRRHQVNGATTLQGWVKTPLSMEQPRKHHGTCPRGAAMTLSVTSATDAINVNVLIVDAFLLPEGFVRSVWTSEAKGGRDRPTLAGRTVRRAPGSFQQTFAQIQRALGTKNLPGKQPPASLVQVRPSSSWNPSDHDLQRVLVRRAHSAKLAGDPDVCRKRRRGIGGKVPAQLEYREEKLNPASVGTDALNEVLAFSVADGDALVSHSVGYEKVPSAELDH